MTPWLIVALGNPGARYAFTRHNIGWLAADLVAARFDARWSAESRWNCELARSPALILLKPLTFMNLSGEAVQPAAAFFKIPPGRILILLDDVALPFGVLRLRPSGSDGGHNGLKSIFSRLGTSACPRLRLGIGGAKPEERAHPGQDLADFVLSPFSAAESAALPAFLEKAADCVECVLKSGVNAAMNSFNKKPSPPPAGAAGRSAGSQQPQPGADSRGAPPAGSAAESALPSSKEQQQSQ